MFNKQLLVLLLIFVTTAFAEDNHTRSRDPRLTVINVYSGLEEVNDLNKNRSATLFLNEDDSDDDDDDDDDSNDDSVATDDDEADDSNELTKRGRHRQSYSAQMDKIGQINQEPDKVRSKEIHTNKSKSKTKATEKRHKQSKIFYNNAAILKHDSPNENPNGLDVDKVKEMKEFVTDRHGFWPKTYNWNSFRKVIQLIKAVNY